MGKDPAFLFYSSDFLSGVSDLTMEEKGQYITLLCLHHQKGRLSKKMISLCCGNAVAHGGQMIGGVSADVMAKFKIDEKGFYFNERLEKEMEKRTAFSEKQRDKALKGWEKRKTSTKNKEAGADATALPGQCLLENEDDNENRNINKDLNEIKKGVKIPKLPKVIVEVIFPFESDDFKKQWSLWKDYKKTDHKFEFKSEASEQAALKNLSELSKGVEQIAIKIIHQSLANGWKGFFELKQNNDAKQRHELTDAEIFTNALGKEAYKGFKFSK